MDLTNGQLAERLENFAEAVKGSIDPPCWIPDVEEAARRLRRMEKLEQCLAMAVALWAANDPVAAEGVRKELRLDPAPERSE